MPNIKINQDRCKGCRLCEKYCPIGLISMSDKLNTQGVYFAIFNNADKCKGCAFCAIICPECAIEVWK